MKNEKCALKFACLGFLFCAVIYKQNQYSKQEPLGCLVLDVDNKIFNIVVFLFYISEKINHNKMTISG